MSAARVTPLLAALALLGACSSGTERPSTSPTATGSATGSASPSAAASSTAPAPRAPRVRAATVLPWQLPAPLSRGVAMRVGPRVLLAGGLGPGDHSTDQVLTLDLRHGVVGSPGRLAVPLHDAAGAVIAGRPTVVGGGGATELSVVQARGPEGRWRVTGHLPGARSDLSVVAAGGSGLVIGGYDGSSTPLAVLRTDGSSVRAVGRLPQGLRYSGTARVGREVYVLGGEVDGRELDEVLRLDVRTGRVRTLAPMPCALGHEAVVAVGDRLLVMGGRTAPHTVTDRMWWFDTATGRWTPAGRLPYPVADAPWAARGSSAYLLGGETPDFTARVTRVSW